MVECLKKIGFNIEFMCFDDVDNLWVWKGIEVFVFCFVGYIDVVFIGNLDVWNLDLFVFEICDGKFYGCGSVDMKIVLVVMVVVFDCFVVKYLNYKGLIVFFIILDEEGLLINGMVKVIEIFEVCNEKMKWCLVGELLSIY